MTATLDMLPDATLVVVPPLPAGWQVLRHAPLADGSLAILATDVDMRAEHRPGAAGERPPGNPFRLARRAIGRIWTFDGDRLVDGPSFPLASPCLLVDRFPDGRWLVARSRADVDSGDRIFAPDGTILGSIFFGDGIEHLKIDDDGRIWVGWFDEGIFGNANWTVAGRDWPPSAAGLACFDDHGAVLREALPGIDDCYALNVVGRTAWSCPYTDFPVIALGDAPERRWTTRLAGIVALAVEGDHVLAAGGYGQDGNLLFLLHLGDGEATILGEWRLPFTSAPRRHGDAAYLDGRGDRLHLVDNGIWHRWSVRDFMTG